LTRLIILL